MSDWKAADHSDILWEMDFTKRKKEKKISQSEDVK